jgi:hypothetical protein
LDGVNRPTELGSVRGLGGIALFAKVREAGKGDVHLNCYWDAALPWQESCVAIPTKLVETVLGAVLAVLACLGPQLMSRLFNLFGRSGGADATAWQ